MSDFSRFFPKADWGWGACALTADISPGSLGTSRSGLTKQGQQLLLLEKGPLTHQPTPGKARSFSPGKEQQFEHQAKFIQGHSPCREQSALQPGV